MKRAKRRPGFVECGRVEPTGSATALALVRRWNELAPVGFDLDAAGGKSIYRRTTRETWDDRLPDAIGDAGGNLGGRRTHSAASSGKDASSRLSGRRRTRGTESVMNLKQRIIQSVKGVVNINFSRGPEFPLALKPCGSVTSDQRVASGIADTLPAKRIDNFPRAIRPPRRST